MAAPAASYSWIKVSLLVPVCELSLYQATVKPPVSCPITKGMYWPPLVVVLTKNSVPTLVPAALKRWP